MSDNAVLNVKQRPMRFRSRKLLCAIYYQISVAQNQGFVLVEIGASDESI